MKPENSSRNRVWLLCCAAMLSLNLTASAAILTNRYSFTTDASDSVGGQNGTLVNGSISSGQAVLANGILGSGNPAGQYVDLPDNIVSNYTAITIETWITPTLDDITAGAFWARVWDFGNSDGTGGITPFFWFRVGNTGNGLRGDIVPAALPGNVADTTAVFL